MILVISIPAGAPASLADALLPQTAATRTTTANGVIFRMYDVPDGARENYEYRDPIDGELLIGYKTFATLALAERWIRETERP